MEYPKPPGQLSNQALNEFKEIAYAEWGTHMTDDEAQEMAMRLLRFFAILARKPEDGSQIKKGKT